MRSSIFLSLLFVACSSSSSGTSSTNDATTDTTSEGGGTFTCPPTAPTAGAHCTTPGPGVNTCEYGGNGHGACTQTFDCVTSPDGTHWVTHELIPGCGTNPSDCAATFGTQEGQKCTTQGETCDYDQGRCGCESCVTDAGYEVRWHCKKWSEPPVGCPSPRPLLGSACTTEGQTCDYDGCCRGPSMGPRVRCAGGVWSSYVDTGCKCVVPACP